jgi:hypothetical protein
MNQTLFATIDPNHTHLTNLTLLKPTPKSHTSQTHTHTQTHTRSAERGGFEPPVPFRVRQFSKLLVSATHPPLHYFICPV